MDIELPRNMSWFENYMKEGFQDYFREYHETYPIFEEVSLKSHSSCAMTFVPGSGRRFGVYENVPGDYGMGTFYDKEVNSIHRFNCRQEPIDVAQFLLSILGKGGKMYKLHS